MQSVALNNSAEGNSFNWKITAQAGEGVKSAAHLFGQAIKRHGWQVFTYFEYPSLIKGDHQTGQVYAHPQSATCQKQELDLLIVFDQAGLKRHLDELTADSIVVLNSNTIQFEQKDYPDLTAQVVSLPLYDLAKQAAGQQIVANMVALGLSAAIFGLDLTIFKELITDEFKDKGQELIDKNFQALELGAKQKLEIKQVELNLTQVTKQADQNLILTGNQAVGLGALAAGLQFYSAYPMTPATGLLHYLASLQENYPLVVKHSEDEIGAINQALGASYAGVRSMVGTSGGGFALMTEAVSLASTAELPLVILEAQRTGPASGMPTWTAQADLQFVLNAGHGDLQRVVLTPGTVAEHFHLTKLAFYLAQKYQLPVFILSDKYILESDQTMPMPANGQALPPFEQRFAQGGPDYQRYQVTASGISPRTIPGQKQGWQLTNSYEHDQAGFATEAPQIGSAQVDKRQRKLTALKLELPQPVLWGNPKAPITLVGWGSTANLFIELVRQTDQVNALHLPSVWPFPAQAFLQLVKQMKNLVMVEGNASGQAEKLIRQETGFEFKQSLRRYDGRPFYVNQVLAELKQMNLGQ